MDKQRVVENKADSIGGNPQNFLMSEMANSYINSEYDLKITLEAIKSTLRDEMLDILESLCCEFLKEVIVTTRNKQLENKQQLNEFKARLKEKEKIDQENAKSSSDHRK